jgi:LDH2 family malate/lactate/ureidoglycolate dehydrogenase
VARYSEKTLRRLTRDILSALGATDAENEIVTDGLMTACAWWHPGQHQGLEKLFRYDRRVRNGGIRPGVRMEAVRDNPASALLDAAKGFGYVAGQRAMALAIDKARAGGIGMVGVRNSNHFGIAGYHAFSAAKNGLIGIAQTNAGAEMAPWGATRPVLGTNPWGIAVPRGDADPIVLDMALTQSGKGMMRWFERAGLPIPENWALTASGERTSDPSDAMDGPLLPIGEHKGYGLSLVTDVLCGVMTGALFGGTVFQEDTDYDVGHVMMAIDPDAFIGRAAFEARLEQLVQEVLSAPPINPEEPVSLPGAAEQERARRRREHGIPIDVQTVAGLRRLSADRGVAFPLEAGSQETTT